MDDKILDQYDIDQADREKGTKDYLAQIERKLKALRNIQELPGIEDEIKNLEDIKALEQGRLSKYADVREDYDVKEPMEEKSLEMEANEVPMDDVIRDINTQINDESLSEEELQKLERRRDALVGLNKKKYL